MTELHQQEWNDNAIITSSGMNERFESHGNKLQVVVPTTITNNQFGVYDIEMEPMARGPKLHYHKLMDETFIVREGTVTVLTTGKEIEVSAGAVIHIPRLSVHGYNNNSDDIVKMTMVFNPGLDRESFFREMYRMLEEDPEHISSFQELYLAHDSYSLNEKDMIPMK